MDSVITENLYSLIILLTESKSLWKWLSPMGKWQLYETLSYYYENISGLSIHHRYLWVLNLSLGVHYISLNLWSESGNVCRTFYAWVGVIWDCGTCFENSDLQLLGCKMSHPERKEYSTKITLGIFPQFWWQRCLLASDTCSLIQRKLIKAYNSFYIDSTIKFLKMCVVLFCLFVPPPLCTYL